MRMFIRGPLSLTWQVTVRNVYPRRPTESDLAGNCEKCLSQRPTESDLAGKCEKCLSQRPH